MSAIEDYRAALRRLIENKPEIVPRYSEINKDTVALEAGRKRGSVKKSRSEHLPLIVEIEAAAAARKTASKPTALQEIERQKARIRSTKAEMDTLKADYTLALQKIVSLVHENYQLRRQVKEIGRLIPRGSNVTPSDSEKSREYDG